MLNYQRVYHVISRCIMLYHVISCYITLYHVISFYIMLYHVTSCYIMLCHIVSCYIMLYHVISRYIMLYLGCLPAVPIKSHWERDILTSRSPLPVLWDSPSSPNELKLAEPGHRSFLSGQGCAKTDWKWKIARLSLGKTAGLQKVHLVAPSLVLPQSSRSGPTTVSTK